MKPASVADRQVLLASRNSKKLAELRRILEPLVPVTVLGLDDVAAYPEAPETEASFAGNALLKAREAFTHTGLLSVADDSGLCMDALNGMPGVLSARWAGPAAVAPDGVKLPGADAANVDLLLAQLADTPDERRTATFVCAVAMVTADGAEIVHEGRMTGRVIRARSGSGGFGYDPIFVADGYTVTTAQLPIADKDAISHRGRALRALLPDLLAALSG